MDRFNISIIQKTYDFYRDLQIVIEKMPKKDKYSIGQKIQETTLNLIELLISAGYSSKEKKLFYLDQAAIKLELLKILIRLAEEIKSIPIKKYIILEGKLQEIGKMLGGWLRSIKAF